MSEATVRSIPYETVRLVVPLPGTFDEAVAGYERCVPVADLSGLDGATWGEIVERARRNAPYDFMIYWKLEVAPLMRAGGDAWPCNEYLMGNHTIAQRMYHHDPAAMLAAPLRTVIYAAPGDVTWLSIDQPSTRFAAFGNPAIAEVGRELDGKLARLLEVLGAPVPAGLRA